jgi:P27 family predicted phage terminase small subunit
VKQRGRKSAALVAFGPRLVSQSPANEPPPTPPAHLGEREKQIWSDIVADWTGSRASFAVLTAGLEAHQRAREARETIDAEGLTVVGRDGQSKAHPLCTVERDARRAFQQTFRQLGIKI